MVDFARLRDVKPESVTEAGKDWQAVAKAFDQARQHIEESVLKPLGTWTGPAATNARHSFGQQELQLQVAALELQAVQQVLDGFVQAVTTAQQELQWVLTEASKRGLTVDANGTVTATPTPVDQLPKNAALRQEAADSYRAEVAYAATLTADIAAAVQAATQADTKCAAELGKLAGESKLLEGSGRTGLAGAVQVAAKDLGEATRLAGTVEGDAIPTDPTARAAWWGGLSPDRRNLFLDAAPWKVQGLPGAPKLEDYYKQLALRKAGIDPSKWDPDKGLDFNDETVQKVYAWYQKLWDENPDFQWAGMAKLAGAPVYGGIHDLDEFIKGANVGGLVTPVPGVGLLATMSTDEVQWFENKFLHMQKDIFDDVGSMHAAYQQYGMAGIEALQQQDSKRYPKELTDAWRDIDSGDPKRVAAGNAALLEREQTVVLPASYKQVENYHGPVGETFAEVLSAMTKSPIPGSKSFSDYYGGEWSTWWDDRYVTDTNDRMDWIRKDMRPKYQQLLANPAAAKTIIDTPLLDRADQYEILP
ncbi:WXG100 family type VII secretion target [Kitasatospora sp. NPDC018058]|uniref:WXG100 family type VII secretion target n=1 Tax=Kitasatospora sp. NPDC018058 TaxID=3364025 RepID=UPI0037C0843E